VSSIAHTLLSTHPLGSRSSRSAFSVMSVGTPLDRFGHATQTTPSGAAARVSAGHAATSLARAVKNATTTSSGARTRPSRSAPLGSGPSVAPNPSGADRTAKRVPSTIPSFFASGVPE
jgi:hypothetical protein